MKKKVSILALVIMMGVTISACNKQIIDTTYKYDKAIIAFPNGEVVEGAISSWTDYEDGDQIQVKINGVSYLVHSSNIVLISE